MRPDLITPPIVGWAEWYSAQTRRAKQGYHILFCGPTQSGKTVLCRLVARNQNFVVVFGTKIKDRSLDAYVAEGYTRIYQWPPKPSEIRAQTQIWGKHKSGSPNALKFVLWPKVRRREDMRSNGKIFAKAMDEIFIDGGWTVVADECLWLCDSQAGPGLGGHIANLAYGGASNGVSLYSVQQRVRGVPPVVWGMMSEAMLWHQGGTADIRELASLGVYDPKAVVRAVQCLTDDPSDQDSHRFLNLPCRAGLAWSISQVAPEWV